MNFLPNLIQNRSPHMSTPERFSKTALAIFSFLPSFLRKVIRKTSDTTFFISRPQSLKTKSSEKLITRRKIPLKAFLHLLVLMERMVKMSTTSEVVYKVGCQFNVI
ncbi:hypothetical protein L596_012691 [Steinernema carpocapsae]|uniref:Uncharacterized protein n=1 Tax=Steinernema carpocapsae TaxID=34508 RepID=A0A4U5NY11_STECR|nr:hypothetical protein L596_012691 [Steinernema carpocapsae]